MAETHCKAAIYMSKNMLQKNQNASPLQAKNHKRVHELEHQNLF
jgi:hypothetical protein